MLARELGHGVVVERERLVRVRDDRALVAGHHVLVAADADHQRAALARHHQHAGLLLADAADGVGAGHLAERGLHGVLEVALVQLADQVDQHLGVGLALEDVALLREVGLDRRIVLDDAVVHQRDAVALDRVIAVRVRVHLGDAAVGRPAGVGNADGAVEAALGLDQLLEHADPADALGDLDLARRSRHGDARGVVSAVLQALEALEEQGRGGLLSDVGNDSAHGRWGPWQRRRQTGRSRMEDGPNIVDNSRSGRWHSCEVLGFNLCVRDGSPCLTTLSNLQSRRPHPSRRPPSGRGSARFIAR